MRRPVPEVASIRDFYAFEQHVATCRRHRGLDMVPQWYEVPVFYFSNPAGVIGHEAEVWAPAGQRGARLRARAGLRDRPRVPRPARRRPGARCRGGPHDHERLERARPSARRDGRRPGARARGRTSRRRSVPSW